MPAITDPTIKGYTLHATSQRVVDMPSFQFLHYTFRAGTDGKNTFLGKNSGSLTFTGASGTQGSYNTGVGEDVMAALTTGKNNTGMGYQALAAATTARDNAAFGQYALNACTSGSYNAAMGLESMIDLTDGEYNTGCGYQTLLSLTTGDANVAVGANALDSCVVGSFNTACGQNALTGVTGDFNTGLGYESLAGVASGSDNVAAGWRAGYTGDNTDCTFVGYAADAATSAGFTNSTAIGHSAQFTKSNQMVLGAASITETLLRGLILVNDTSNAKMTVGLTLNQGASDDEIFAGKSSDVGHGMTDITEADTFFRFAKAQATVGGLLVDGLNDADDATGGYAILLRGIGGVAANTTKSTAGVGVVVVRANVKDTTSVAAVGSDGNLFAVQNGSTTRFIMDAEGSGHADVEWTTF